MGAEFDLEKALAATTHSEFDQVCRRSKFPVSVKFAVFVNVS